MFILLNNCINPWSLGGSFMVQKMTTPVPVFYELKCYIAKSLKETMDEMLNPMSPGGSFMVQKMAITSPIPVF